MANVLFRTGRCASSTHRQQVPKAQHSPTVHRRPHCKQDERLHHFALQCEALVILLQETHCTSVERLDLSSYHLAGFSLSRKHGLATFVHERLKWILIDQSPPTSKIEWVCVDVDNYKIINAHKPPPTRMQASDLPTFLPLCWRLQLPPC